MHATGGWTRRPAPGEAGQDRGAGDTGARARPARPPPANVRRPLPRPARPGPPTATGSSGRTRSPPRRRRRPLGPLPARRVGGGEEEGAAAAEAGGARRPLTMAGGAATPAAGDALSRVASVPLPALPPRAPAAPSPPPPPPPPAPRLAPAPAPRPLGLARAPPAAEPFRAPAAPRPCPSPGLRGTPRVRAGGGGARGPGGGGYPPPPAPPAGRAAMYRPGSRHKHTRTPVHRRPLTTGRRGAGPAGARCARLLNVRGGSARTPGIASPVYPGLPDPSPEAASAADLGEEGAAGGQDVVLR